jgi:hypothetical protein
MQSIRSADGTDCRTETDAQDHVAWHPARRVPTALPVVFFVAARADVLIEGTVDEVQRAVGAELKSEAAHGAILVAPAACCLGRLVESTAERRG